LELKARRADAGVVTPLGARISCRVNIFAGVRWGCLGWEKMKKSDIGGPDEVVRLQVKAELGLDNSVRCLLRHRALRDAEGWLISIWVTASMCLVGGVDKTNGTAAQQTKTIGCWLRSKFRSSSSSTEQSGSTRLGKRAVRAANQISWDAW
jgi:hypothetical protein